MVIYNICNIKFYILTMWLSKIQTMFELHQPTWEMPTWDHFLQYLSTKFAFEIFSVKSHRTCEIQSESVKLIVILNILQSISCIYFFTEICRKLRNNFINSKCRILRKNNSLNDTVSCNCKNRKFRKFYNCNLRSQIQHWNFHM